MAETIGTQDGITAFENDIEALDPDHKAGYEKFVATLRTLKDGHNEVFAIGGLSDRVKALESRLPFPVSS